VIRTIALVMLVGLGGLVGCGSSRATQTQPPPPPPPPPPPNAETCPATFAAASGACEPAGPCNYPEGACHCGWPVDQTCSGAAVDPNPPPPTEPVEPMTWQCTAKPPEVRADGCPGVEPFNRRCDVEGKQCSYGSCCVRVMTCKDGAWRETAAECPP
jgi:hypothetical protein